MAPTAGVSFHFHTIKQNRIEHFLLKCTKLEQLYSVENIIEINEWGERHLQKLDFSVGSFGSLSVSFKTPLFCYIKKRIEIEHSKSPE